MKGKLTSMAQEAWLILNDILGDLFIARKSFDTLEPWLENEGINPYLLTGFRRMFYFHLFLALSKWVEFYDRYKAVITEDCQRECAELRKELVRRGVIRFRNKYIGHIWDKETKRPLSTQEIIRAADSAAGGKKRDFLAWIFDPKDNVFPKTVLSILERTRNRIAETHSLEPQALLKEGVINE